MDDLNLFIMLKQSYPLMIILFITFPLIKPALSADIQFESCEPKRCGENLIVKYPFWIPFQQESYCGHPKLETICKDDKPMILISGENYVILNIFYHNQTFLVANANSFNDSICLTSLHNLTFPDTFLSLSPDDFHLYFFYNCTSVPPIFTYPIPCANYDDHRSYAAVLHKGASHYFNASSEDCDSVIAAPIDVVVGETPEDMMKMKYKEILRKGFVLEWNSSYCSDCEGSGGRCGFDDYKFVCYCKDKSYPRKCKKDDKKAKRIGVGVAGGVGGILLTCVAFFIYQRRRKLRSISSTLLSQTISSEPSSKPDLENGSMFYLTPIFKYDELVEATENFHSSKELGDGGFGTVYYGKLQDGRVVAVKRLYEHNYKRVEQFMNEIKILSRLRHPHLVFLYGCTSHDSRELLLVYEYVPNGTVADHLHGQRAKAGSLPWPVRMNIAVETADALAYLHATDIIHRDVKTTNILLDNNFHVKVADFGLSRLFPNDATHVSTAPQGTPGYVDPEYYQCYQLNSKSDVYSFGVVLIELISSKPAVDISRHRHEINLANMAVNKILNHALHELVDPSLGFESDYTVRRMITLVAELAFRCLQQEKEMRPTMKEVLECLKKIESDEDTTENRDELDVGAEKGLLKGMNPPFSPNSVTDKWASVSTTPNTSA